MFITLIFTYNNHLNLHNETIFVCNITYIMPFNKKKTKISFTFFIKLTINEILKKIIKLKDTIFFKS